VSCGLGHIRLLSRQWKREEKSDRHPEHGSEGAIDAIDALGLPFHSSVSSDSANPTGNRLCWSGLVIPPAHKSDPTITQTVNYS